MFSKWLFYGVGTLFSLAVLSVMVALALDMVLAVSAAFWVGKFTGSNQEGINSMALQQGGLGLILTVLIVTAPPMAASFFQGVLGQFSAYNQFANPATPPGRIQMPQVSSHVTHASQLQTPHGQQALIPNYSPAVPRGEHSQDAVRRYPTSAISREDRHDA